MHSKMQFKQQKNCYLVHIYMTRFGQKKTKHK